MLRDGCIALRFAAPACASRRHCVVHDVTLCALRVVRRLGLFGFLAHEALRKRSASGSAGNFGIQVGRSGLAGLAALAGGTHGVLTA
jgi:hypothetical protein